MAARPGALMGDRLLREGAAAADWSPPEVFEEYRLVKLLGAGSGGAVYLAHDFLLERPVSVKFLKALDEQSLGRFLVEARAAARVQHPNVVMLYRAGRLENRPFLVSEYARGMPLDAVEKPVGWETALSFALDLARGLSAAHRCGVLHRDIKPANAILTEAGQVKLLDFGLAKLMGPSPVETPPGAEARPVAVPEGVSLGDGLFIVGTPDYMAPEIWRGEATTPRSDLYSLGALLYELCAGRAPSRFVRGDTIPLPVAAQRRARPLAEVAPSVQPAFAALVDRCLEPDPSDRFASAEALLDALQALAARHADGPLPEGNPYRGLQAFEAEHRALFFGREREVASAVERLRSEPFLVLAGDSGVGKSSLGLAGILPAVADGELGDGRSWHAVRMVPGRAPVASLAAALSSAVGVPGAELEQSIREGAQPFARKVRAALGEERGLLLYLDQMEELLTLGPAEDARRVAGALEPLAAGLPGVRLLASARSDFLTRLAALPRLGDHLPRAIFLVRALTAEELREAVVGPARRKGGRFESDVLVDGLVASAEHGGLPLLQFALAELWEARDAASQVITARSVEAIGGVSGALARHAESVLQALLPEQRDAARAILLRLVTAEGTRARRTEGELLEVHRAARQALEALVRGRLVVAREAGAGSSYEIAHEALIAGCATLAGWLGEEAETRAARERLALAAAEWERRGRDRESLWGARSLEEAAEVKPGGLTGREREFLEASRRSVRRARWRRRAVAVAAVAVLLAPAGLVPWLLSRQRERAIDAQERQAQSVLEEARALTKELPARRARAFELFDGGKPGADEAWQEVREAEREADARYGRAGAEMESAIALGAGRSDLRRALGEVYLQRALLAEAGRRTEPRNFFLERMRANDPTGELDRTWTEPARLDLQELGATVVTAARFERQRAGPSREVPVPLPEPSPAALALPADSYVLTFAAAGRATVRYPVLLGRGERRAVQVQLPAAEEIPAGFAYVPAGRFLFGSGDEESIRQFLGTVPLHAVETPAFLIALRETTYAEWIEFLESLPPSERERRSPRTSASGLLGAVRLLPVAAGASGKGGWVLELQPTSTGAPHRALVGELIEFSGRTRQKTQDWLRFPVAGIAFEDAQAYAGWLSASGRVPGARLCTEHEWERAARGADDRAYPHGDQLLAEDANFDRTYGKNPNGFGPTEVGSHPASRSPFGVDDMAGNVWEWTISSVGAPGPALRGGSYYVGFRTSRAANRQLPEPTLRDPTVGLRVCATLPSRAVNR